LHDDRQLSQQILALLAHVEQRVFFERPSLLGIGSLECGDGPRQRLIQPSRHEHVLLESGLHRPQIRSLLFQGGIVPKEFVRPGRARDDRLMCCDDW
jgi:hypothetical protein